MVLKKSNRKRLHQVDLSQRERRPIGKKQNTRHMSAHDNMFQGGVNVGSQSYGDYLQFKQELRGCESPLDPRLDLDHEPRATAMLSCARSVLNGD